MKGGGPPGVSRTLPVSVSGETLPFGVQNYELSPLNENGTPDTEAGSHPVPAHDDDRVQPDSGCANRPSFPKDLRFGAAAGNDRQPKRDRTVHDGGLRRRLYGKQTYVRRAPS